MIPLPHQIEAIDWLVARQGALLGDDPGCGKSLVAIEATRRLYESDDVKSALVVCPKTLIHTWVAEFEKWWPDVDVAVYGNDLGLFQSKPPITIIYYDKLVSMSDVRIKELQYDLVITDEAQRFRNRHSLTARCMRMLNIPRRWALTGTPIENSITDLMSIFEFLLPHQIESDGYTHTMNWKWTKGCCEPSIIKIPINIKTYLPALISSSYLSEIPQLIAPYFLRRRLRDIINLPDYIVQDIHLDLGDTQRMAYDSMATEKSDSIGKYVKLQQICNFDPDTSTSVKMERFLDDLEAIIATGNKVLVFSQFREEFGVKRLAKLIPGSAMLHGDVPNDERKRIVVRFNRGAIPVLVIHYRVGGIGLNLQAARYVYLFDRCWNPAVEEQAVRRSFRLGQDSGLLVRRFMCRNTIETDIIDTANCKRLLSESVLCDYNF